MNDFTHPVGPRVILPDSPLGIFQLFFTMEVIEMIVEQTNLYAYQCMGDTAFEAWQKVTAAELEAFFGFMILMGIVRLPSLLDYWKNDVIFHYIPVASRISRNRFFDLKEYLHFANNTTLVSPGCEGIIS